VIIYVIRVVLSLILFTFLINNMLNSCWGTPKFCGVYVNLFLDFGVIRTETTTDFIQVL
jgi:hypothetical protein